MYKKLSLPSKAQTALIERLSDIIRDFETAAKIQGYGEAPSKHFFWAETQSGKRRLVIDTGDGLKNFFELPWQKRISLADEILAMAGEE